MVAVAQLVRALDCGSGGRAFEPRLPPQFNKGAEKLKSNFSALFFCARIIPADSLFRYKKVKKSEDFSYTYAHSPKISKILPASSQAGLIYKNHMRKNQSYSAT